MSSKILSDRQVDDPIQQTANFRYDKLDRAYIDEQIRGTQQHVVDNLVSGITATWYTVSADSPALSVGDVVCLGGSSAIEIFVTLATAAALANAGRPIGICLTSAAPTTDVRVAMLGVLPPSITGLVSSDNHAVRVGSDGRCETVASFSSGDYPVGFQDNAANLTLNFGVGAAGDGGPLTGDAGGHLALTYPNPALANGRDTKADLRALTVRAHRSEIHVAENNRPYRYDTGTGANVADNGYDCIKPTDVLLSSNGRWVGLGETEVPTIAALRTLTSGYSSKVHVRAYATEGDGGGGHFLKRTGSATDNGGTIIVPTGVTTFYYERQFSGPADARWFGARLVTDTSYDSQPAIQAALDACGDVFLPGSTDTSHWYYCADTIAISGRRVSLSGPWSAGIWTSYCRLKFPAGVNGIVVDTTAEAGSKFSNILLVGGGETSSPYAQGITIRVRTDLYNVECDHWSGSGCEIWGSGGASNCNSCRLEHVRFDTCGWLRDDDHPKGSDGIYVHGNDANACTIFGLRTTASGRYGIHDNSFLGNHYYGHETDTSGQAKDPGDAIIGLYVEGDVNSTKIFGFYSESENVYLGPCAKIYGGPIPTNYLVGGSTGSWDSDVNGYGMNQRLVTQSRATPGTQYVKTTYAPADDTFEPALFYWQTPADQSASRLPGFYLISESVSKSGFFFSRFQVGEDPSHAFGISDGDCYRGSGQFVIPEAYYLGNSGTSLKRHWQATDRTAAHLKTLEVGDSYLYTVPIAGGAIGEIVTRSGFYANPRINSHSYALNDYITLATDNGHYYKATSIGSAPHQTAGSPPAFNTGAGSTTTDGDITWTEQGTSALFTEYGYVGTGAGPTGPTGPAGPAGSIERRKDSISGATSYGFAGSSPTTTLTANHTVISMTASGAQNVTFKRTGATNGSIVEVAFYTGAEDSVTFFDETRGDIGTLGGSTNDITTPFYASFVFLDSTDGWVPLNKGDLT